MTELWIVLGSIGLFFLALGWARIAGKRDRHLTTQSGGDQPEDSAD